MNLKIAFDFDDVLVDFVGAWCKSVQDVLMLPCSREDLILEGWDMGKHASQIVGMDWLDEWFRDHMSYWINAETEPDAVDTLWHLGLAGHQISIVTNKPDWARIAVWSWLEREDPHVDSVIIANHFSKEEISDADVLVDDRPDTIRRWEASRPDRLGVLYARSQNINDRIGFTVAEDFGDVERIVGEFAQLRKMS
jgi:deoxypyrimidine-specific 5' nucleotidase type C protein (NT5C)